jgi:hypothetical protein
VIKQLDVYDSFVIYAGSVRVIKQLDVYARDLVQRPCSVAPHDPAKKRLRIFGALLQLCCTSVAPLLHLCCTSVAPLLHLCCTSVAALLHLRICGQHHSKLSDPFLWRELLMTYAGVR